MANGDAAVAAGMDVVPATADRRLGYDEINKTRDYLAARTNAVTPVDKGGTGATSAATARANLGITASTVPSNGSNVQGDLNAIVGELGTLKGRTYDQLVSGGYRLGINPNVGGAPGWATDQPFVSGPLYSPHAYNNPVTVGTYYALYIQPDGRLGRTPSAAKYKHDIEDYEGSVLGLRPVTYVLNDDPEGTVRLGIIADEADLIEPLLVQRDGEEIEGFSYELLAVALLGDLRRLSAAHEQLQGDVLRLAARVDALENPK